MDNRKQRAVYKWKIGTPERKHFELHLPKGSEVLTAKIQYIGGEPNIVLWTMTPIEEVENEIRHFLIVYTGQRLFGPIKLQHINSLISDDGLVFHVFEIL